MSKQSYFILSLSTQKTTNKYKGECSITSLKIFWLRFKEEKIMKSHENKCAWRKSKSAHISNWWQHRVNGWCFLQLDKTIENNSLHHFSLLGIRFFKKKKKKKKEFQVETNGGRNHCPNYGYKNTHDGPILSSVQDKYHMI